MDMWQVIGQLGFPIAVATLLLIRMLSLLERFARRVLDKPESRKRTGGKQDKNGDE